MSKPKAQSAPQAVAVPYEPTERERQVLEAVEAKRKAHPRSPEIKVEDLGRGGVAISTRHADNVTGYKLLAHAVGSGCTVFAQTFVENLAQATASKGQIDAPALNSAIDMTVALHPQDEAEAMLAAQMAMIHRATMHAARRVQHSDTLQQMEANDRCLNRLTRTFAAQMDALKRYRTGGQQRVIVEHVHVYEGGQAIVGSVHHGGGGAPLKPEATS